MATIQVTKEDLEHVRIYLCKRFAGSRQFYMDAMQSAVIKAIEYKEPIRDIRGFLITASSHFLLNETKRKSFFEFDENKDVRCSYLYIAHLLVKLKNEYKLLHATIEALPPMERQAFLTVALRENDEAIRELVPENKYETTKAAYRHARIKLAKALKDTYEISA